MGRKVNTIHKNFLEDLQARMRDRYTNNYANYTESDKAHAKMAGPGGHSVGFGNFRGPCAGERLAQS